MEVFNPSRLNTAIYRSNQSGSGLTMDRYIYNQSGEGIASFFGNLVKMAIPFLGSAIKGIAKTAKPHLQSVAKDIISTGAKRAIDKLSGDIIHKVHSPKRSSKRRRIRRQRRA